MQNNKKLLLGSCHSFALLLARVCNPCFSCPFGFAIQIYSRPFGFAWRAQTAKPATAKDFTYQLPPALAGGRNEENRD